MLKRLGRPTYPYQFYPYFERYRLDDGGVFVFGSNLAGIHGAGAAATAHFQFGAVYGQGVGFTGKAYAVPTKDYRLRVLPLQVIEQHIEEFVRWTITESKNSQEPAWYFVTAVGTGLSRYQHKDIAPFFKECVNCWFPTTWIPYLER